MTFENRHRSVCLFCLVCEGKWIKSPTPSCSWSKNTHSSNSSKYTSVLSVLFDISHVAMLVLDEAPMIDVMETNTLELRE